MIDLLRRLVAIDSTSSRSNLAIIDVLESEARRLGFETRRLAYRDARGVEKANLIARRGPAGDGGLALVGHTDCVPFDWAGALGGEVRDGKLFGRGAADTKAFIACALSAAARARPAGTLWLVFTADEEVGCVGARKLVEERALRPRYAIAGEPTRLIPVRAHKGYCLAEIEVAGLEAHSAFPELGRSAVLAAGRLLGAIERIQDELRAERDEQFSPPFTSLNVGLIQGGKAKNVVPGSCSLTLEWRPIPGQDVRRVLSLVEAAAASLGARVTPTRLDAGVSVPGDAPLVRFLEEASERRSETIPFGTELPQLVALGAEACVFGPGDIRVAHRAGEFVPLDELEAAERILVATIDHFCV